MMTEKSIKPAHVFVFGLDGISLEVIEPWLNQGKLPAIRKLIENGVSGDLKSVYPPSTAPAWASFSTGKNPGKHGIFDLTLLDHTKFEEYPPSSGFLNGQAIWDYCTHQGKKSIVAHIPVTYPPKPLSGLLITDFLSPKGKKNISFPPELIDELENEFGPYRLHHNQVYSKKNIHNVIKEAAEILNYQANAAKYLIRKYPWDLGILHFFSTDRILHELWHVIDPGHPNHDPEEHFLNIQTIETFFKQLDIHIDEIIRILPEDTVILLVSDHGFGPVKKYFVMNLWLHTERFLLLKKSAAAFIKYFNFKCGFTPDRCYKLIMKMGFPNIRQSGGIGTRFIIFNSLSRIFLSLRDVDWTHTVAYSKGNYAQIYINLRGHEPNGIVSPGEEYLSVRQRIVEKLKNLKIEENGNSFVGEIYTKDEIYQGIFNSVAPDIFLLPGDPSFKALGTMDFIGNKFIIDNYAQSGDHRMQGIFVACGPGIKKGGNCESARLIDIHPTVLRLLDLGISSDLDGKPLEEIFTDDFLEKTCVKKIDPINKPSGSLEPKDELNHEDQKGIKKLLKGFGYIG